MNHDLSKLHPIHQQAYNEFVRSRHTPDIVPDELYAVWLDLNETVPDIIGKQQADMSKAQKVRYEAKALEFEKPITAQPIKSAV